MKNILKKAKKSLKNLKNSLKVKKLFKKLPMNERKKIPWNTKYWCRYTRN